MDVIVDQIISIYIGPYASPGLLLAATASIVVLLTGLGARIVELVQTALSTHRYQTEGPSRLTQRLIPRHTRNGELL